MINRRYQRVDGFTVGRSELQLACGRKNINPETDICRLHGELKAEYGWLTLGPAEAIGVKRYHETCRCPALEPNALDLLGAGDAFCSVAALAAARSLPLPVATFMGQIAGALSVRIIGNAAPIEKTRFLKTGMTLLSF